MNTNTNINYIVFASAEKYPDFLILYNSLIQHDPECLVLLVAIENFNHIVKENKNLKIINKQILLKDLAKGRISTILEILSTYSEISHVVLLGADCYMINPPTALKEIVNMYDIILTPHITRPFDVDGKCPPLNDIHLAGLYNSDLTVFKNTDNTKNILKWLISLPFIMDRHNGFFCEQSYFNFIPVFFNNIFIFKDIAYNIAYWNIFQRHFTWDTIYKVKNMPACIMHFSGFNNPSSMSVHNHRRIATGDILKVYTEYYYQLQKYKN